MARALNSPPVRIGVLKQQRVIRCHLEGKYLLQDAQGHTLATLNGEAGQLEFRPADSVKPAVVLWRSVLCKSPTPEAAALFKEDLPKLDGEMDWEVEQVGTTWSTPEGTNLDSREWWVHTPAFESKEALCDWCIERHLPHQVITPKIRRAPQGQIMCQCGGITSSGLTSSGLFRIVPVEPHTSRIALHGVVVGISFHWQHLETQWLRGSLDILLDLEGKITAVNTLTLEEYLCSVVGSEMKAEMPHELLKVQAVCARNTFLATAGKHHYGEAFDLCNDDHCQCYRGSSRETREAREAAISTFGEVLIHGNRLCDTRYSKICGGVSEAAHSVWGGPPIPYMASIPDFPANAPDREEGPLDTDEKARAFVTASPHAFCNAGSRSDLPEYLQYASKYYRWTAEFTREELQELFDRSPEINVGEVRKLEARKRGASGRIEELAIIGTKGERVIGRELVIRQTLSHSTLYSSAFVADHEHDADGRLVKVTLQGAGWGHGAGMCQVGATLMAIDNYTHEQILTHYFKGTSLRLVYDQPTNWAAVLEHLDDGDFSVNDRCWERTNCYEVVGCPIYEKGIGSDKGYIDGAERTKMYLDCPEYREQTRES